MTGNPGRKFARQFGVVAPGLSGAVIGDIHLRACVAHGFDGRVRIFPRADKVGLNALETGLGGRNATSQFGQPVALAQACGCR